MTKARNLASGLPAPAGVSTTELGYVDGVTSAIQTQIDSKIGSAAAINPTIVDAKGDIIAATAADAVSRLAVGANNTVLTADSSTATGLKWAAAAGGGKVLQVVFNSTSTLVTVASTTFTDSGLTATITPSATSSKILIIYNQNLFAERATTGVAGGIKLLRGATIIQDLGFPLSINIAGTSNAGHGSNFGAVFLDSPATISATTYKTQVAVNTTANSGYVAANNTNISSITLLEIGA